MKTTYNGRNMRSQLEARWASFFDKVGWQYDYEPALDLNGWLPDFILYSDSYIDDKKENGRYTILVEVKPYASESEYDKTLKKIDKAIKDTEWEFSEILLLGSSIFKSSNFYESDFVPAKGIIGWLYQICSRQVHKNGNSFWNRERIIREAYIIEIQGKKISYDLTDGDLFSRFQGYWFHNYGSSYSFDWSYNLDFDDLKSIWNEAGNDVQWKK